MRKIKLLSPILTIGAVSMSCLPLVSCGQVKVTGIVINARYTTLGFGQVMQCSAKITPSNATNKNVAWSVSNDLATITSAGVLTAGNTAGTFLLTATAKDGSGIKDEITITIANIPIPEDPIEYIHDRIFSILGMGTGSTYRYFNWGTCWIISDATPDTENDYKYYIATNWHVILGQDSTKAKCTQKDFKVYFGDNKKSSGLDYNTDYTQFTSYTKESESNFCYKGKTDAIDFYVAKANFSNATGTTKTKLDKLNALQKEKGYITQFANSTTAQSHELPAHLYIGGFPVQNGYYATWENHEINSSETSLIYYNKDEVTHEIDGDGNCVDKSPQYIMNTQQPASWMMAGASGSMLLGDDNGTLKVYGIYWGGFGNEGQPFYPAFSIFKSDSKDFIDQYLPK